MMDDQFANYRKPVKLLTIVLLLIALVFFALHFVGYGTLSYNPQTNQSLSINGKRVDDSSSVKLRPATYTLSFSSPRYITTQEQVHVSLFRTTTYQPKLVERTPTEIVSSAIGAFGQYGPPLVFNVKWFNADTWMAAAVGPNDAAPIALHYTSGNWQVAYFDAEGYPQKIDVLPANVATYTQILLNQENSPQ